MAAVAPAPEDYVAADAAKLVAPHVEDDEQQGGCCCCGAAAAASSSLARRATAWCRRKLVPGPVGRTEPAAKRVLVAVASGTEPLEAAAAADILSRAGARVTVATVGSAFEGLVVEASHGVRFAADARVADLETEEFDLIVLPGGMVGSANLRDCKHLEKMVRKHVESGRLCGAIGAAPAVALADWGVLEGFRATCYPALLGRLGDDRVIAVDDRVVKDRNVVTSQGVGTAIEFALALVEQLYGKRKAKEVAGPLYVRPQQGVKYTIQEYNQIQWKCTGTPRVLVPVANGSEEMEALNLIDVLRRAGARVTVASVEDAPRIVTRHYKLNLITDMMLEQAAEMEFDLIVMPGGLPGALKFITSTEKLVGLLKKQAESAKPYGAICASPAYVLEPHGLLKGKKATSFPPMAHLLTDQSACEYRVVVDGNLITSRAPGTATEFALAIVEKLFGEEKAIALAKELVFM